MPEQQQPDEKLCGKNYQLEDTTTYVKRDAYLLEFFAYEEMGMGLLREPLREHSRGNLFCEFDSLHVGDKAYVPHPISTDGWWVFTVKTIEHGRACLESDSGVMCDAVFETDRYDGPQWVGSSFGDIRGIERIDFS